MQPQCKSSGSIGGLYIETVSGTSLKQYICTLGTRTNIQHLVYLENLHTYPVKVDCTGLINANPNKLQFFSPYSTDTDKIWYANTSIGNGGKHTFSHVNLHSLQTSFGNETVDTRISADWYQQKQPEMITLTINITV